MNRLFAIEVRRIGPLGHAAFVSEVQESGRDGAVLFTTRIYDDPEYVAELARQWIADNSERIAS